MMMSDTGTRRSGRWATRLLAGAALAGAFGLAACSDDDPTGPGAEGTVETYMEDRSASASAEAGTAGSMASQTSAGYSGTLDAQAQVQISADGETWVDLGSPASVSVELQSSGDGTQLHGVVEVPADTYTHVRLVMDGPRANLAAGSTIGGIDLTGALSIDLGTSGQVTIEKTVPPFEVSAESQTRVTWDMNTHLWMNEQAAEDEEVEEEEVEDAAEPRTDQEATEQPE